MWEQGQSGNPAGRLVEKKFLTALNRAIAQDNADRLRQAAEALLSHAADGQPWAIAMLADRLDGRPAQQVIATDSQGKDLALAILSFSNTLGEAGSEVRSDDTLSLHAKALPAPDTEEPGQRH